MTRREEDRASDITAIDCDACGDEGHTHLGGGNIATFKLGDKSLHICDSCLDFGLDYEGVPGIKEPGDLFDLDELTAEQFTALRSFVDETRKDRKLPPLDAPPAPSVDELLEALRECITEDGAVAWKSAEHAGRRLEAISNIARAAIARCEKGGVK